jgi:hypothetical protein
MANQKTSSRMAPFDARSAFAAGDSFYRLAAMSAEQVNKAFEIRYVAAASSTNLALSAELWLKCLRMRNGSSLPLRSHDLRALFDDLESLDRDRIRSSYAALTSNSPQLRQIKAQLPTIDFSLDTVLDEVRDSFVQWRYVFESANRSSYGFIYLSYAIRDRIVELEPGWGRDYKLPPPDETPFVFM